MNRLVLALTLVLLARPVEAAAQRRPEPLFQTWIIQRGERRQMSGGDAGTMSLAGFGGAIAGALVGGYIGVQIDADGGLDAVEGAVVGGLIGTSVAIPIAVHLANGSRGDLRRSMLMSSLIGGAMLGIGLAAESGEIVLLAPVAQVITSVAIEGETSR